MFYRKGRLIFTYYNVKIHPLPLKSPIYSKILVSKKMQTRCSRGNRSSHQRCSIKKSVLGNFTKFTGKHLCQILFFNKVAGLSPAILSKKRLWHRCFPVNFAKFLRASFFIEHLWWLLLVVLDNLLKLRN